jgi:hypothetical protein
MKKMLEINDILIKYFNEEIRRNGIKDEYVYILLHEGIIIPKKYFKDPTFCISILNNSRSLKLMHKIPASVQNDPDFIEAFTSIVSSVFAEIDEYLEIVKESAKFFKNVGGFKLFSAINNNTNLRQLKIAAEDDEEEGSAFKELEKEIASKKEEAIERVKKSVKSDALLLFIELNIR